jgi:hypothetical protein
MVFVVTHAETDVSQSNVVHFPPNISALTGKEGASNLNSHQGKVSTYRRSITSSSTVTWIRHKSTENVPENKALDIVRRVFRYDSKGLWQLCGNGSSRIWITIIRDEFSYLMTQPNV